MGSKNQGVKFLLSQMYLIRILTWTPAVLTKTFNNFPQPLQANIGVLPSIRPQQLHTRPFQASVSQMDLPVYTMQPELMTAALNKP